MSDLEKAFKALTAKQGYLRTRWNYYDGNQPLKYSQERLSEVFGGVFATFRQNWCSVVVDCTLDRIVLKGFDVPSSGEAAKKLNEIVDLTNLDLDAEEIHRDALITGKSFVIAWKRENGSLDVYHNRNEMCHIFYDPEFPKQKKFAAKWFFGTDEKWHMTLYYPEKLEYFVSSGKEMPTSFSGFKASKKAATNPFGEIPVFEFNCQSDLNDVLEPQDAVNKLAADMMVASEFGSFKQRWVISNSNTATLKNSPNEVWDIPAGDGTGQQTSVGEFAGEDLTKFLNAVDKWANYVAIKTRTPKHYLKDVGAGISGDALIAMEAPLIKKCGKRVKQFGETWKDLASFLLRLEGISLRSDKILPVWDRIKSEQPLAELQAINFGVSSGLALKTMLRREGWTSEEIAQAENDKREEDLAKTNLAKVLLEEARKKQAEANLTGFEGAQ